jgi:hypothetical protein
VVPAPASMHTNIATAASSKYQVCGLSIKV